VTTVEILLISSTALLAIVGWAPFHVRRKLAIAAAVLVLLSGIASVAIDGLRWQLVPILAAAAIALGFATLRLRRRDERQDGGRPALRVALAGLTTVGCLGLIAAGGAAAWAFPALQLPAPAGSSPVGTTVVQWVDDARPEQATGDPADRRTVVAQLWYPAAKPAEGSEFSRYLGRDAREADLVAGGLSDAFGVPRFLWNDAVAGWTNSVTDAAPATGDQRYPVVVFSPGSGGVRSQNTAWAENLASHGYVVVALDHPYDSAAVVLDDGSTIRSRLTTTGNEAEDKRLATAQTVTRAADLSFALTQLERIERGEITGPLTGRLDTDHAAVVGHSLGGAAAIRAGIRDPRFDAIIDIDGYPYYVAAKPFAQPLLALVAGTGTGDPQSDKDYAARLTEVFQQSSAPSYRLTVPGAGHLSFTDASLFLPPVPALLGSLDRASGPRITAGASLAFLDATLRDAGQKPGPALARFGDLTSFRD
jgi:predicted dienelactone hydrolase